MMVGCGLGGGWWVAVQGFGAVGADRRCCANCWLFSPTPSAAQGSIACGSVGLECEPAPSPAKAQRASYPSQPPIQQVVYPRHTSILDRLVPDAQKQPGCGGWRVAMQGRGGHQG
jgi:hypothetical protein